MDWESERGLLDGGCIPGVNLMVCHISPSQILSASREGVSEITDKCL